MPIQHPTNARTWRTKVMGFCPTLCGFPTLQRITSSNGLWSKCDRRTEFGHNRHKPNKGHHSILDRNGNDHRKCLRCWFIATYNFFPACTARVSTNSNKLFTDNNEHAVMMKISALGYGSPWAPLQARWRGQRAGRGLHIASPAPVRWRIDAHLRADILSGKLWSRENKALLFACTSYWYNYLVESRFLPACWWNQRSVLFVCSPCCRYEAVGWSYQ